MAHYFQKLEQIRFSLKFYLCHSVKIRHFELSVACSFRQFFSIEGESLKRHDGQNQLVNIWMYEMLIKLSAHYSFLPFLQWWAVHFAHKATVYHQSLQNTKYKKKTHRHIQQFVTAIKELQLIKSKGSIFISSVDNLVFEMKKKSVPHQNVELPSRHPVSHPKKELTVESNSKMKVFLRFALRL